MGPGPGMLERENTASASMLLTDHCRINRELPFSVMSIGY